MLFDFLRVHHPIVGFQSFYGGSQLNTRTFDTGTGPFNGILLHEKKYNNKPLLKFNALPLSWKGKRS